MGMTHPFYTEMDSVMAEPKERPREAPLMSVPQKRPQKCYFFGPKSAIVDKDVTFPRRDYM